MDSTWSVGNFTSDKMQQSKRPFPPRNLNALLTAPTNRWRANPTANTRAACSEEWRTTGDYAVDHEALGGARWTSPRNESAWTGIEPWADTSYPGPQPWQRQPHVDFTSPTAGRTVYAQRSEWRTPGDYAVDHDALGGARWTSPRNESTSSSYKPWTDTSYERARPWRRQTHDADFTSSPTMASAGRTICAQPSGLRMTGDYAVDHEACSSYKPWADTSYERARPWQRQTHDADFTSIPTMATAGRTICAQPSRKSTPRIPSYLRPRIKNIRLLVSMNDVELRLVQYSSNMVWARRRSGLHPSKAVQVALNEADLKPEPNVVREYPVIIVTPAGERKRALIEYVSTSGVVTYVEVDSGQVGTVPETEVFRATGQLLSSPTEAVRCQIDESTEQPSSVMSTLSATCWSPARIRVVTWGAIPTVQLLTEADSGSDTDDEAPYQGDLPMPTLISATSLEMATRVQKLFKCLPGIPLPPGRLALLRDCKVVSLRWPIVYFVWGEDDLDEESAERVFDDEHSTDSTGCDDDDVSDIKSNWKPGDLCAANVGPRISKCRVFIKAIEEDMASVEFIDNGGRSYLPLHKLAPLTPQDRLRRPGCLKGRLPANYLSEGRSETSLWLSAMSSGSLMAVLSGSASDDDEVPTVQFFTSDGREICVD